MSRLDDLHDRYVSVEAEREHVVGSRNILSDELINECEEAIAFLSTEALERWHPVVYGIFLGFLAAHGELAKMLGKPGASIPKAIEKAFEL